MSGQRWAPTVDCTALNYRAYVENHADGVCRCPPNPDLLHRDGVPWWKAEPHWWWQRCRVQTIGHGVERCSCGAARVGSGPWLERKWRWR